MYSRKLKRKYRRTKRYKLRNKKRRGGWGLTPPTPLPGQTDQTPSTEADPWDESGKIYY